jgi:hypothetical protein
MYSINVFIEISIVVRNDRYVIVKIDEYVKTNLLMDVEVVLK